MMLRMDPTPLDLLPGFRRRFRITPLQGAVCSELEDDFHCMSVTVRHSDGIATAIEPTIERAPWSTCPGALVQLRRTFVGVALGAFAARGAKRSNCTHLHDLALLAAAHVHEAAPLTYDILISDPIDNRRQAELRRDGVPVLAWLEVAGKIAEPAEIQGRTLSELGPWIVSLTPTLREAARLLRWACMVASGRTIPLEQQSDVSRMPVGNCYTFQPEVSGQARRIGLIRDFSRGELRPLATPGPGAHS
jgi:hypothetical protein